MGYYSVYNDEFLMHHGIMGMKWGIRRYQNADGSLTDAGRKRYGTGDQRVSFSDKEKKKLSKKLAKTARYHDEQSVEERNHLLKNKMLKDKTKALAQEVRDQAKQAVSDYKKSYSDFHSALKKELENYRDEAIQWLKEEGVKNPSKKEVDDFLEDVFIQEGISDDKVYAKYIKLGDAQKAVTNSVETYAKSLLGEYSDKPIILKDLTSKYSRETTVGKEFAELLIQNEYMDRTSDIPSWWTPMPSYKIGEKKV